MEKVRFGNEHIGMLFWSRSSRRVMRLITMSHRAVRFMHDGTYEDVSRTLAAGRYALIPGHWTVDAAGRVMRPATDKELESL